MTEFDCLYMLDTVHDVTIMIENREQKSVERSAELLGQRDEDAPRVADVTEPVFVLVLHQLANELGAAGAEAGNDILEVVNGEHDATYS